MFVRLLVLLGMAAAWSGCAARGWYLDKGVCYQRDMTVELERATSGSGAPESGFAHPAHVPEEAVARLVAGLTYDDRETRRAVVHQSAVPALARAIVQGLARADATSRVRFMVMNPGRTLFFVRSTTTTRGVAFVKPAGVLNLAFDQVDEETGEFEDETWVDATREARSEVEVSPPAGARYHVDASGTVRPLWITLPLEPEAARAAANEPPQPEPIPPVSPPAGKSPTATAVPTEPGPAAPARPSTARSAVVEKGPDPKPQKTPTEPGPVKPVQPAPEKPEKPERKVEPGTAKRLTSEQILERLRTLEKLYDEGTITEEQYRTIRRKLLKSAARPADPSPDKQP